MRQAQIAHRAETERQQMPDQSFGKGEVESSILSGSTIFSNEINDTRPEKRSALGFTRTSPVAALFVSGSGCYSDLPNVDAWPEERDARTYAGPHPVVAHPPCQRWGRFWHGSTRKPHQFQKGDDDGCLPPRWRPFVSGAGYWSIQPIATHGKRLN